MIKITKIVAWVTNARTKSPWNVTGTTLEKRLPLSRQRQRTTFFSPSCYGPGTRLPFILHCPAPIFALTPVFQTSDARSEKNMHHRTKWIVGFTVSAVVVGFIGFWFAQLAFTQNGDSVAICHVPPGLGAKVEGILPPVDTTAEQTALADIAKLILVDPESEADHIPGHVFDYFALPTVQTPSAKADYTCDPADLAGTNG